MFQINLLFQLLQLLDTIDLVLAQVWQQLHHRSPVFEFRIGLSQQFEDEGMLGGFLAQSNQGL